MSEIVFQDPDMLDLLWALPLVAILYWYAAHRRRRALAKFARQGMLPLLVGHGSGSRRAFRMLACCVGVAMGVIALARPAWNIKPREVRRAGRDIVFVLDVSKSMSARDAVPNRLHRARTAIIDCLGELQGDRVSLVAFAGSAEVRCPLTLDYAFFRMILEDTDHMSVSSGGTRIANALEVALEDILADAKKGYSDIILITDGEDHDSSLAKSAPKLASAGARLIAIGVGDDVTGMRIPVSGAFLTHEDREVWTRLDSAALKQLVGLTADGVYHHAGVGAIDLPGVYRRVIASAQRRQFESQTIVQYEEKFQIFLGVGLVAIFAAMIPIKRPAPGRLTRGVATVLFAVAVFLPNSEAQAGVSQAAEAYRRGDYQAAAKAYRKALDSESASPELLYNLGNAMYRSQRYSEAREAYEQAAVLTPDGALKANCLHNLGNCMFRIAQDGRKGDPKLALQFYRISGRNYRAAIDLNPKFRQAAINMELARRAEKVLEAELQSDRDKLEKQMQEIRKLLIELIKRQTATEALCAELTPETVEPSHAVTQAAHGVQARKIAELIQIASASAPKLPEFINGKELGFNVARRHVLWAASAQDQATVKLRASKPAAARPDQQKAIEELKRALKALPSDGRKDKRSGPDGQSDDSQKGEPNDSDKKKPDKSDKGDRPAEQTKLSQEAPESEEFTAPLETPEDILSGEKRNKLKRAPKRPVRTVTVDKDW